MLTEPRTGTPAAAPETTVRGAVHAVLRRLGMTSVFGNPGSTELPMFRDFPADFRYVLGLQEAVVVGMADGYAQASGNAAVVNLHSAAGVGHAMGAIFTAYKNHTPLVITAGQQARSMLPFDPFLASPQATELAKPYVKWSIEPARAQDVAQAIARAYCVAMQPPRGPVLVSIPVDDWDRAAGPAVDPHAVATRVGPDPQAFDRLLLALDTSRAPAFVVGSAADRDGAWPQVVALAERHQARVYTAPMAGRHGFPQTHPLFAGFLPARREGIVAALQGHDLVLVLGCGAFTCHVDGQGPHLPAGASLWQVVDDPATAAWAPVGMSVLSSVDVAVAMLLDVSDPPRRARPAARPASPHVAASGPMTAAHVFQALARHRGADDIVVEEAPSAKEAMQDHLPTLRSAGFYAMDSGGLGFAMPAAVGIALADTGRKVICVIGDGSSMYSIQALWTAAQLRLPVTFVVLNNGGYGAMRRFAPVFGYARGEPVPGTDLPGLDLVGLAQAMGCRGLRARDAGELAAALPEALHAAAPTLLDITIAEATP